jgi:kumamolisin
MGLVERKGSARSLRDGEELVGRLNPERKLRLTIHVKRAGDTLRQHAVQFAKDRLIAGPSATGAQFPLPFAGGSPGRDAASRAAGLETHGPRQEPQKAGAGTSGPPGPGLAFALGQGGARPGVRIARQHFTRQQFAEAHGLQAADERRIRQFARQYGFEFVPDLSQRRLGNSPKADRTIELRGTVANIRRAFGVDLVRVRDKDGDIYHTYQGLISVPSDFDDVVGNVFGLDSRPQVSSRARSAPRLGGSRSGGIAYTPPELAKAYGFPTGLNGAGQTIAIIEMDGGYRPRDLRRYFAKLGIQEPQVEWVGVAGGRNAPTGNPNGPDSEVLLDIEVAGAVANGAKYVIYFARNKSNQAYFKTVSAAIHDSVNQPSVLSISWGGAEGAWTTEDMQSIDEVFQAASLMGITVFAAAGDGGSTDGVKGAGLHVDFPASSPWVTSCGGTSFFDGLMPEIVWNDGDGSGTGGGISAVFPIPDYQQAVSYQGAPLKMRGVPDVAGNADPNTGYKVRIDGSETVYGGTSAVAPLWSALTALINQSLGSPIGFINPLLYQTNLKTGLNDISIGNNDTTGRLGGKFPAVPGWDPCTGWGSPAGEKILALLQSAT